MCMFLFSVPSPPVNVRTRSWSLSSVRVSWDEVPVDDRNGDITGYIVELRNGSGLIRNRTVDGENNRTAVLDGLEMFVTYNISVRAKTKAGPGGPSSPVNATTNQTSKIIVFKTCSWFRYVHEWTIDGFPSPITQYVLGSSLHKNKLIRVIYSWDCIMLQWTGYSLF